MPNLPNRLPPFYPAELTKYFTFLQMIGMGTVEGIILFVAIFIGWSEWSWPAAALFVAIGVAVLDLQRRRNMAKTRVQLYRSFIYQKANGSAEAAVWLNTLVAKFYRYLAKQPAIKTMVDEAVEPAIKEAIVKPVKSITIDRLNLGDEPPMLTNFKVYKTPINEPIVMDCDIDWASKFEIVIALRMTGASLVPVTLLVSNLTIKGKARVELELCEEMPFVENVHVALRHAPFVDMDIKPLKGPDLMAFPGLNDWIRGIVINGLETLILPAKITIPLADQMNRGYLFGPPYPPVDGRPQIISQRQENLLRNHDPAACEHFVTVKSMENKIKEAMEHLDEDRKAMLTKPLTVEEIGDQSDPLSIDPLYLKFNDKVPMPEEELLAGGGVFEGLIEKTSVVNRDPCEFYVVMQFGKQKIQTNKCKKTKTAFQNKDFSIKIPSMAEEAEKRTKKQKKDDKMDEAAAREIEVSCYEKSMMKDSLIAKGVIDLVELTPNCLVDHRIRLTADGDSASPMAAMVYLAATFKPTLKLMPTEEGEEQVKISSDDAYEETAAETMASETAAGTPITA